MEFEEENTVMAYEVDGESPLMRENQIEETAVGTHSENNNAKLKNYLLPISSLVYAMLIAFNYAYLGRGGGHEEELMSQNHLLLTMILCYAIPTMCYTLFVVNSLDLATPFFQKWYCKLLTISGVLILVLVGCYFIYVSYPEIVCWENWGDYWYNTCTSGEAYVNVSLEKIKWLLFCTHCPLITIAIIIWVQYSKDGLRLNNHPNALVVLLKIAVCLYFVILTCLLTRLNVLCCLLVTPAALVLYFVKENEYVFRGRKIFQNIFLIIAVVNILALIVASSVIDQQLRIKGAGPATGWWALSIIAFFHFLFILSCCILAIIVALITSRNIKKGMLWGFTLGWLPGALLLIAFLGDDMVHSIERNKESNDSSYYQTDTFDSVIEEIGTNSEFEQYLIELDSAARGQENDSGFRPTRIEIDDSALHELFKN